MEYSSYHSLIQPEQGHNYETAPDLINTYQPELNIQEQNDRRREKDFQIPSPDLPGGIPNYHSENGTLNTFYLEA